MDFIISVKENSLTYKGISHGDVFSFDDMGKSYIYWKTSDGFVCLSQQCPENYTGPVDLNRKVTRYKAELKLTEL